MKKYYGLFVYRGEEYVIRFKIDGSLKWDSKHHCFEDAQYYVRSAEDMIYYAAIDTHWSNDKHCGFACLISHDEFVRWRSRGIKRWKPKREILLWD